MHNEEAQSWEWPMENQKESHKIDGQHELSFYGFTSTGKNFGVFSIPHVLLCACVFVYVRITDNLFVLIRTCNVNNLQSSPAIVGFDQRI